MPSDYKKLGEAMRKRQAKRRKQVSKATKGFKEAKSSTVGEKTVTEGKGLKKASTAKKDDKKKKKDSKKKVTVAIKSPDSESRLLLRNVSREDFKKVVKSEGKRLRAKGYKNLKAKKKKKKD